MPLRQQLSDALGHIQGHLFPWLRAEVGPLTEDHERLVTVLGMVCIEAFVPMINGLPGRPPADRPAPARAFVAKAVFDLPTTSMLIERLAVVPEARFQHDATLRRLCGWQRVGAVPSEATFSRAFAEMVECNVPARVHEALIKRTLGTKIVGHIARDATAIEARETPEKRAKPHADKHKRKRGRPRKGEVVAPKPPRRLERQLGMTLSEMLADLPTACDVGTKRNAKGYKTSWIGYKLHIDTADGDIPVSCLLTSASVHDSQVAIPLAIITASRVTSLNDLMDSAHDAPEIAAHSRARGHVPIIDHKTRRGEKAAVDAEARAKRVAGYQLAEDVRYRQRSSAERVNANLKDNCGGNHMRVRGGAKVFSHLMLGIVVITVEQLMRLVT
jgi:hypothetical protein